MITPLGARALFRAASSMPLSMIASVAASSNALFAETLARSSFRLSVSSSSRSRRHSDCMSLNVRRDNTLSLTPSVRIAALNTFSTARRSFVHVETPSSAMISPPSFPHSIAKASSASASSLSPAYALPLSSLSRL